MRLSDRHIDYLLAKRFGLTPEEVECARRLRNFSRDRLGIDLHVGQLAFGGLVLARDPNRGADTAKYLTLLLSSGNRAGKTMLLAVIIIYCCLDKTNRAKPVTPAQAEKWLKSEYHWYHFGIVQEVADLVYNEIVRILGGTHEAQEDGCPLSAAAPVAEWGVKENSEYRWVRFGAVWGGAEVHFRTTSEKALGSLGKDMHGLSFDEAGIERNLPFLDKEVFNLRRLGTGGQLLYVSTPSEDLGSDFADMWELGNPKARVRRPTWMAIRMSTRDNIGYGLDQETFDRLIADMDDRTIRQNIEGEFLQAKAAYFHGGNVDACFIFGMPERSPVKAKGLYLQGVDPAKSADSAWSIVLKVEPNPDDDTRPFLVGVRAEQRRGQKSTETLVALAADAFNAYNVGRVGAACHTAIDATGFGGKMFREALESDIPNLSNVEFGGTIQKKRMLLGNLRTVIDEGRLLLPHEGIWQQVRRQLLNYREKTSNAREDDAVMALVCAVHLIKRTPLDGATSQPLNLSVTR